MIKKVQSYELIEVIGYGGMGIVYKAKHQFTDEIVAVKALAHQYALDPELRKRFQHEALIMKKLKHDNIVQVKDFIEEPDCLYMVMEFVEGRNLEKMIGKEVGPIVYQKALPLFLQILKGIEFAHKAGVIHRDIKPGNILVTGSGQVKITDFGIAKMEGMSNLSATGSRMGTLCYMSPEQFNGEKADIQSDIYSLGMTLYVMLAGRLPFSASSNSNELMLIDKLSKEPLEDPRNSYPGIPEWLVKIVFAALERDKGNRISTVTEFMRLIKTNSQKTEYQSGVSATQETVQVSPLPSKPEDKSDHVNHKAASNVNKPVGNKSWMFKFGKPIAFISLAVLFIFIIAKFLINNEDTTLPGFDKSKMPVWSAHFPDTNNGWMVGWDGLILHTTDGGKNWERQKCGTNRLLSCVFFADSVIGWIGSLDGDIFRTSDGGKNWARNNNIGKGCINAICFTDKYNGFAGCAGGMMHTTNSGESWQLESINGIHDIRNIRFTNANEGWCESYNGFAFTTNSGRTWISKSAAGYRLIGFADAGNVWGASDDGKILKISNPGQSSQTQFDGIGCLLEKIFCVSKDKVWIAGSEGILLSTSDGGRVWKKQFIGTKHDIEFLNFFSEDAGIVISRTGQVFRTYDGGLSWKKVREQVDSGLNDFCFTDSQTGYAVSEDGGIMKTTDGGNKWIKQNSGTTNDLVRVVFTDQNFGYAVGSSNTILKTTNGGKDWQHCWLYWPCSLKGVAIIDRQNICAVGAERIVLMSRDGGASWQPTQVPYTKYCEDVCFTSRQNGVIVGYDGVIMNTTDGGNQWIKRETHSSGWLYSVSFADENNGFAAGWNEIMRTRDGGKTWVKQDPGSVELLRDMCYPDPMHFTAVGEKGQIVSTTDGGNSWKKLEFSSEGRFTKVHFINSNEGWAYSEKKYFVHTTDGGRNWKKLEYSIVTN